VPRGRKADDRLGDLERRLEVLEAEEARPLERPQYTDEEIVEIGLILLAYVHEGDVEAFAEYLLQDLDMPFEMAKEIAGGLGRILEERRAVAPDPRHPV
jgi:hypothetical protein